MKEMYKKLMKYKLELIIYFIGSLIVIIAVDIVSNKDLALILSLIGGLMVILSWGTIVFTNKSGDRHDSEH